MNISLICLQVSEEQPCYFDWCSETELRRRWGGGGGGGGVCDVPEKIEKKKYIFLRSRVFFSQNFVSISDISVVFYPLILLARHAVPIESIDAANAAPAAPLSKPMGFGQVISILCKSDRRYAKCESAILFVHRKGITNKYAML